MDAVKHDPTNANPLADSTMDELKIIKVSLIRNRLDSKRDWIATLRTVDDGYCIGRGVSAAEALGAALRELTEKQEP